MSQGWETSVKCYYIDELSYGFYQNIDKDMQFASNDAKHCKSKKRYKHKYY